MQADSVTPPPARRKRTAYRWVMARKREARPWLGLAIAAGLLSAVLLIVQSMCLAQIVQGAFIEKLQRSALLPLLWLLLAMIVVRAVLAWAKEVAGVRASLKIRQRLRAEILQTLSSQGPVLAKSRATGAWVSAMVEQVEGLNSFYAAYLPQMWLAVLIPLIIVAVVFSLNWVAGLILLITAPLIPIFMALVGMGAASINQSNFQRLAKMSGQFLDVLQGLTTLKLFYRSREQVETLRTVSDAYRQTTMQALKVAFLSSGVLELFSSMAIALLATYLGLSLLGDIHLGRPITLYSGLLILLLAPEFFMPLRELGTHYHARAQALGAAEELMPVLEAANAAVATGQAPVPEWQAIHYRAVGFSYPKSTALVLQHFNLSVQRGEKLAIVGPSGVGKSTLVHLLLRFLEPSAGSITLDQQALSEIELGAWRAQIAWVSQSVALFQGSLRDNVLLARPTATEAELQQALSAAQLSEWIAQLPQGLATMIGEQNLGVSGGQAQRIALARAYLKQAPIWVLDEPTASLDANTEQAVLAALVQEASGKTLIVVTHREAVWQQMDRAFHLCPSAHNQ